MDSNVEKLSIDVATPCSPIPAALASDAIIKKGTAVVITSFLEKEKKIENTIRMIVLLKRIIILYNINKYKFNGNNYF